MAPFTEMVENYCCRSTKNVNCHNILLSIVSMFKIGFHGRFKGEMHGTPL